MRRRCLPSFRSFSSKSGAAANRGCDGGPKTLIRRRSLVAPASLLAGAPAVVGINVVCPATSSSSAFGDDGHHDRRTRGRGAITMTVPLTLADYHLRKEQLPFGFFFRETIDPDRLEVSLRRVLRHFPEVAGRLSDDQLDIECRVCDAVPFSAGDKDMTLTDWLHRDSPRGHRNHRHASGEGHPALLDIFDSLFPVTAATSTDGTPSNHARTTPKSSLLSVRVTSFTCGGTAIGVNWNHVLGDTASLLHFVNCWGRDMRDRRYDPTYSNVRADAACSGMSRQFQHVLEPGSDAVARTTDDPPSFFEAQIDSILQHFGWQPSEQSRRPDEAASTPHQYLYLHFPAPVLAAMKAYGMVAALETPLSTPLRTTPSNESSTNFVSTNDMITAFAWLLKRSLSGHSDHNISMVVNLRGRSKDLSPFHQGRASRHGVSADAFDRGGLLGNAITNVIASCPPTSTEGDFGMAATAEAAVSIRTALRHGVEEANDRIQHSRQGRPKAASVVSHASFATTSWSQFDLEDIRFGAGKVVGFHGHPSHPLPLGCTYSSVICPHVGPDDDCDDAAVPTRDGSGSSGALNLKLLLPAEKVSDARRIHADVCSSFVDWHKESLKPS